MLMLDYRCCCRLPGSNEMSSSAAVVVNLYFISALLPTSCTTIGEAQRFDEGKDPRPYLVVCIEKGQPLSLLWAKVGSRRLRLPVLKVINSHFHGHEQEDDRRAGTLGSPRRSRGEPKPRSAGVEGFIGAIWLFDGRSQECPFRHKWIPFAHHLRKVHSVPFRFDSF
ncbi:histidine kinase [Anopheles sinensis]|uniref:Histidine kinase n=1 Tax=Anopheles sinensis TaxID=74873 RepID=A0A084W0F1_ANOSI|nr:histidine kinase [Anopheles sinensis]